MTEDSICVLGASLKDGDIVVASALDYGTFYGRWTVSADRHLLINNQDIFNMHIDDAKKNWVTRESYLANRPRERVKHSIMQACALLCRLCGKGSGP